MKNLEIEQLKEKDELNADALISLEIGSKAVIEHSEMRKLKSITSINRERATGLPYMDVTISIKQSMESDWISASESLLE
jgi:predicted transcriptional regulator